MNKNILLIISLVILLIFSGCTEQTIVDKKEDVTEKINGETYKIQSYYIREDGASLYRSVAITKFNIDDLTCYSMAYGGLWCRTIVEGNVTSQSMAVLEK